MSYVGGAASGRRRYWFWNNQTLSIFTHLLTCPCWLGTSTHRHVFFRSQSLAPVSSNRVLLLDLLFDGTRPESWISHKTPIDLSSISSGRKSITLLCSRELRKRSLASKNTHPVSQAKMWSRQNFDIKVLAYSILYLVKFWDVTSAIGIKAVKEWSEALSARVSIT